MKIGCNGKQILTLIHFYLAVKKSLIYIKVYDTDYDTLDEIQKGTLRARLNRTLRRMKKNELITFDEYKRVVLTEKGITRAKELIDK